MSMEQKDGSVHSSVSLSDLIVAAAINVVRGRGSRNISVVQVRLTGCLWAVSKVNLESKAC